MASRPVSADIFDAITAQTELFELILKTSTERSKEILGREALIRRNFWGTWDYRSLLMTFDIKSDDKREGFHPYGWFINYNRPDNLVFMYKESSQDDWQGRDHLNLSAEFYFSLTDHDKKKIIEGFVCRNLKSIISEVEAL